MRDVDIPTWGEVNTGVVLAIAMIAFLVYAWFRGKREEERTVTWVRDWEEFPNRKQKNKGGYWR